MSYIIRLQTLPKKLNMSLRQEETGESKEDIKQVDAAYF